LFVCCPDHETDAFSCVINSFHNWNFQSSSTQIVLSSTDKLSFSLLLLHVFLCASFAISTYALQSPDWSTKLHHHLGDSSTRQCADTEAIIPIGLSHLQQQFDPVTADPPDG
jgi:hypothetical protein